MASRLERIDQKRKFRSGTFFILSSVALLVFLLFVGIGSSAKFALFLRNLKGTENVSSPDKTPPGPPRVDPLPRYAQSDHLTITGFAEANSKVKVYDNEKSIAETDVSDDSKYSVEAKLEKGDNRIIITATDAAGNEGAQSVAQLITYDTDPPVINVDSPKDNEEVDTKNIIIKGTTEIGATISAGDRSGIVGDDGTFTVKFTLSDGSNSITLTSVDAAGNKTEKTLTVVYTP